MIKNIQILLSNLISFVSVVFWNLQDSFNKKKTTNSKKLLCVNTEKMGDLILSLDFLNSLQESGKYENCFLLVDENFSDLFKCSNLKYVILPLNKKMFKFHVRLIFFLFFNFLPIILIVFNLFFKFNRFVVDFNFLNHCLPLARFNVRFIFSGLWSCCFGYF